MRQFHNQLGITLRNFRARIQKCHQQNTQKEEIKICQMAPCDCWTMRGGEHWYPICFLFMLSVVSLPVHCVYTGSSPFLNVQHWCCNRAARSCIQMRDGLLSQSMLRLKSTNRYCKPLSAKGNEGYALFSVIEPTWTQLCFVFFFLHFYEIKLALKIIEAKTIFWILFCYPH